MSKKLPVISIVIFVCRNMLNNVAWLNFNLGNCRYCTKDFQMNYIIWMAMEGNRTVIGDQGWVTRFNNWSNAGQLPVIGKGA